MKSKTFLFIAALILPAVGQADALFGNSMAGDRELPRTWGIGIDYFSMRQPYQIDSLSLIDYLDTPGGPVPVDLGALLVPDPSVLAVNNEISNVDLKLDVWVFPFLNVFALYGQIDGETKIDLRPLGLPLPPQTNSLTFDYDGDVFGGGVVLAVGGDKWFASVTATFTDTDLQGSFESSVEATTIQPRIGLRSGDNIEIWVGGYILDAEEKHSGTVDLDLGPLAGMLPVDGLGMDFAVDLSQSEDFNPSIGLHMMMTDSWETTIEVGFGDRRTALANFTYRF